MFKFLKKSVPETFRSFGTGVVLALEKVPDQVFSSRMMGDGYALDLTDGHIYAPVSGEVTLVFPTGHAFGITTGDGVEVLIHLGIDTVELNGQGFDAQIHQGAKISQGDLLTIMDLELIQKLGKSTISPMIFTSGKQIILLKEDQEVDHLSQDLFEFSE